MILNAPHPGVMQQALKKNLRQFCRSWYAFAFQVPVLPESLLRRDNFHLLERSLIATSRPGAFDHADIELLKSAWGLPDALRSMIHWYRAALRSPNVPLPETPIAVPTLIIWGVRDKFLGPALARSSFAQCQDAKIEWVDEATHWVAREQPDRVNELILEFLERPGTNQNSPIL